MMTELLTAAAVGASFVFVSDRLKTKLLDRAAKISERDRKHKDKT